MNLTGAALLVALLALGGGCGGLSRTAATAALEPLPFASPSTPVLVYIPETITLNDCHVSRLGRSLAFTRTQLGAIPLTTLAAASTDVVLTGRLDDPTGCDAWVLLSLHGTGYTATLSGGSRCHDGERSCGFQTSGRVVRLR
jgi:hypothetical protein